MFAALAPGLRDAHGGQVVDAEILEDGRSDVELAFAAVDHDKVRQIVLLDGPFEPTQQHLPDGLNTILKIAVQTKAQNLDVVARTHLDRAMELATKMGYL